MSHFITKFSSISVAAGVAMLVALSTSAAPPAAQSHASAISVAHAGTLMIGDFEGKITTNKQYGTLVLSHGHEFGRGTR